MSDHQDKATEPGEITVDQYMSWVQTFDCLEPELRYLVLEKAGGQIVSDGSGVLQKAHAMLLREVRDECSEEALQSRIKDINRSVYERDKKAYVLAIACIFLVAIVAIFNFGKFITHASILKFIS